MFLTNKNEEIVACILLGKKLCSISFAIKGYALLPHAFRVKSRKIDLDVFNRLRSVSLLLGNPWGRKQKKCDCECDMRVAS